MVSLQVDQVTTILDDKELIKEVSFTLREGEVLALVGHNGAGKSTLMKTIMRMLEKRKGTITIQQYDQDEQFLSFKKHLSYLPEEPILLTELTVMQHFQLYAMSYDMDEVLFNQRLDRFVKGFELTTKLQAYPEELSKGMRQKVQTICALLPDVPVLLIDEPFMGLDIYAVDYLLKLVKEKVEQGTSILLTTHQLNQLQTLADRFLLLEHGQVKDEGAIEQFETITRGRFHD
ncbi:ABC transporter ATP-binding protein [Pseudogracilibacillus auburnensis]|uniref:ABC-2 type transport system ATP-binding protein n=1 Tax=Pseudogracilibacillus auburnensis TaxID=1494959 RepID=A0A2V3WNT1_9BACI|nr:ABC transporter ATP-binding protein [Pseudogracilibacillus auburnensis]MBO1005456.1 ABC transporter ATP-binding protein [Pseudogracilibacillus auburnensis]PXW90359.1 ABC-2 type transport system ATP-binding protein [Pseudogracilibacillus auburnensis]